MTTGKPTLAYTIAYYEPLLQRYARRIINNTTLAAKLVRQVLEDQYEIDGLAPSKHLRQVLKTDVLNRCHFWKQAQIFDRPPVNVPLRKYENPPLIIDNDETIS